MFVEYEQSLREYIAQGNLSNYIYMLSDNLAYKLFVGLENENDSDDDVNSESESDDSGVDVTSEDDQSSHDNESEEEKYDESLDTK